MGNELKYGWWYLGKGYLKKCPHCGSDFYGRKNRDYCSKACKIKANNDAAYLRRRDYQPHMNIGQKNAAILKYLIDQNILEVQIPELLRLGFIGDGPQALYKNNALEGEWYRIGSYAYQVDLTKNITKIRKLDV